MDSFRIFATHYSLIVLLGLIIYLFGFRLTCKIHFNSIWEENAYYTGNPFFPFLSSIFGHSFWDFADIQSQYNEMTSLTQKWLRGVKGLVQGVDRHTFSYLRRGARPNELFFCYPLPKADILFKTFLERSRKR